MLCLAPIPTGYAGVFVGVWSSVQFRGEQAGTAFFDRFEKRESTADSTTAPTIDANRSTSDDGDSTQHHKRTMARKDRSCLSTRVRKAIEDEQDLYRLLALDPGASQDDLKRQYKKMALIFHPDKRNAAQQEKGDWPDPSKMTEEQIRQHFVSVQNAFEILSEDALRRQYDSSLPFDDSLPTDITAENFYEVCGPAFIKEAKWSTAKPVPKLGDANTPIDQVRKFYKFWVSDFISWRDFSSHGEYDLDEAQDREERRWMQKENWKLVSKFVKQERARVLSFVTLVESKDPRLNALREAERQRKEALKKSKSVVSQKNMDDERKRREEEQRKAVEQSIKEAAQKKSQEKKQIQEIRKRIRTCHKLWCSGVICEFTVDDLQDFMVQCGLEWLQRLDKELSELTADAEPAEHPQLCHEVSRLIRRLMSEFINSRYKSSFSSSSSQPAEEEPVKETRQWTMEELSQLSKALVKYPGGTASRWVQIAKFLGPDFTPDEVICQAKALSDVRKPHERKVDTLEWSADQQTALERALAHHPPSGNPQQRWTNIANEVPGKSARECAMRFKEIRDAIRSKQ